MAEYFNTLKKLISEKAGVEPEEITEESFFEDDLNVSELEFLEILQELEERYNIELVEERENIESVGDLLNLLAEKLE